MARLLPITPQPDFKDLHCLCVFFWSLVQKLLPIEEEACVAQTQDLFTMPLANMVPWGKTTLCAHNPLLILRDLTIRATDANEWLGVHGYKLKPLLKEGVDVPRRQRTQS